MSVCVVAVREVDVDACLERAEAGVVEACGLGAGEGLTCEVGECGAAPERERAAGVVVGDQLLEALGVELAFLDAEEVAG